MLKRLLFGLIIVSLISLFATSGHAALMQISAALQPEGYGRIIIGFPNRILLPKYSVTLRKTILVTSFDTKLEGNFNAIITDLSSLIGAQRLDPDGKTFRLLLTGAYRVNTFEIGNRLIIDILPENWSGIMPGAPMKIVQELAQELVQKKTARRTAIKKVKGKVRLGVLPYLNRIVFEWEQPVETIATPGKQALEVTFIEAEPFDIAEIKAEPPPYLEQIEQKIQNNSWLVTFKPKPNVKLRYFNDKQRFVIDLLPASGAQTLIIDGAKERLINQLDKFDDNSSGQESSSKTQILKADKTVSQSKNEEFAKIYSIERDQWLTKPAKMPDGRLRVGAKKLANDTLRLVFPYQEKVESAVFEHSGKLWLIFDSSTELDLSVIKNQLHDRITALDSRNSAGIQIIRLALKHPEIITINQSANDWILSIGSEVLPPTEPIVPERTWDDKGNGILRVRFPQPGRIHWLKNPDNGEVFAIVTGLGPARGFTKPYDFIHVDGLASQQGLVFRPQTDDLQIVIEGSFVLLQRPQGLSLTKVTVNQKRQDENNRQRAELAELLDNRPEFIDLKNRRITRILQLKRAIAKQQEAIRNASNRQDRTNRRMELAKLAMMNELGYEAIGVLGAITADNPAFSEEPKYLMLLAIANLTAWRPDVAFNLLDNIIFQGKPDAALFKAIAAGKLARWADVEKLSPLAQMVLEDYPHVLQSQFWLTIANLASTNNDKDLLAMTIPKIDPDVLGDRQVQGLKLLQAKIAKSLGDNDRAIAILNQISTPVTTSQSANAKLNLIHLRHSAGLATTSDTIAALEVLSVTWRSDGVEIQVIDELTNYYVMAKKYREAFNLMTTAIDYFPYNEISRNIQKRMGAVFANLFLGGAADELTPIKALTLYYDYRELTPPGIKGDAIIRYLANRLIELDLLEMAAELLEYQVANRLSGAARAGVAARLAVVYLAVNKPEKALKTLYKTRYSGISDILTHERRLINCRALAAQGKYDLALELLASANSFADRQLRIDIYWQAKYWLQAGMEIERLIDEIIALHDQTTLQTYDIAGQVLKAAASYAQIGDTISIDRVRSKYQSLMLNKPEFQAFEAITSPEVNLTGALINSATIIASVDTLQDFAKKYLQPKPD